MDAAKKDLPETTSGALRYIDKAAIQRAMSAVSTCQAISIGLPIVHGKGPVAPMRQPPQHYMRRDGGDYSSGHHIEKEGFGHSDDVIILGTHGTTHVDALCHVFCDGKMFGDLPATDVGSTGANKLGAETIPPIVTRAVVIDAVPADKPWLDPSEPMFASQLQALIDDAGITPEPGDALIVRTGSVEAYRAGHDTGWSWPGLAKDCVEWVRQHKFSIIGADNVAVEVGPSGIPGEALPLHVNLMKGDGVLFLELLDLEQVKGRVCLAMLTLNPLRIVGGTASPVAPMLMF